MLHRPGGSCFTDGKEIMVVCGKHHKTFTAIHLPEAEFCVWLGQTHKETRNSYGPWSIIRGLCSFKGKNISYHTPTPCNSIWRVVGGRLDRGESEVTIKLGLKY